MEGQVGIELEEWKRSSTVVAVLYLRQSDTILVVEQEQILVRSAHHPFDSVQEPIRTLGYTVAAHVHIDPLTNQEFLLLVKDGAVLHVFNHALELIETFETEIDASEIRDGIKFVLDNTGNAYYMNLTRYAIFLLDFQVEQDRFHFKVHSTLPCIYKSTQTIQDLSLGAHMDFETGEDFITIAVLVRNAQNTTSLELLKHIKKRNWTRIIQNSTLSEDSYQLQNVPYIGIFCFSNKYAFFYPVPGASEHTIANGFISTYYKKNYQDNNLPVYANFIVVSQDPQKISFKMLSKNGESRINATLELVEEDFDAYGYMWQDLKLEKADLELPIGNIDKCFHLKDLLYAVTDHKNGIFFVSDSQIVKQVPYRHHTIFDSTAIGHDLTKYAMCGGNAYNQGFIEQSYLGYDDFFFIKDTIINHTPVTDAWMVNSNIYYKDTDQLIYCNANLMKDLNKGSVSLITETGETISDRSIVSIADISNSSHKGAYVCLKKTAIIEWHHKKSGNLNIPSWDDLSLVKCFLYAVENVMGQLIIFVVIENKLTIIEGGVIRKQNFLLNHGLSMISGIFMPPFKDAAYFYISDLEGNLCCLDYNNCSIKNKLKVTSHTLRLSSIPNHQNKLLVYAIDAMIILDYEEQTLYWVDTDISPSRIIVVDSAEPKLLIISGNRIYLAMLKNSSIPRQIIKNIDSNNCFYTKILSLPCSNRYLVTVTLKARFSAVQMRTEYITKLQLHDLFSNQMVSSFNVSQNYYQSMVSDVIAIPYIDLEKANSSLLQAKKLAFGRCFLLALDYEAAEDDTLDNLLLFSIDDSTGTIELQKSLKLNSQITCLKNYYYDIFLAAGETLQAFQINYSLKENIFEIIGCSNAIPINGKVGCISLWPQSLVKTPVPEKRRKLARNTWDTIVLHNYSKGLQEYNVVTNANVEAFHTLSVVKFHLVPVIASQQHTASLQQMFEQLINVVSPFQRTPRYTYFLACHSGRTLVLARFDAHGVLDASLQFVLPQVITTISLAGRNTNQLPHRPLFVVGTASSAVYFIHETFSSPSSNMEVQLELISANQIGNEMPFNDTRVNSL